MDLDSYSILIGITIETKIFIQSMLQLRFILMCTAGKEITLNFFGVSDDYVDVIYFGRVYLNRQWLF